jgi:hypothetical protein
MVLGRRGPADCDGADLRGRCGPVAGGGCSAALGCDSGSCGRDGSPSCACVTVARSGIWQAGGDRRSGGSEDLRFDSTATGREIRAEPASGCIDPDLSDSWALDAGGIARYGKMSGRRSGQTNINCDIGFPHSSRAERIPSRGSWEVLLSGCGSRRNPIWDTLVDPPAMGQDLPRRMAEAAVVERSRAMALSRIACPEREAQGSGARVFHWKAIFLTRKALTDNNEEGTIRSKVTKTVINGVWEWASPRFAVWLVACF